MRVSGHMQLCTHYCMSEHLVSMQPHDHRALVFRNAIALLFYIQAMVVLTFWKHLYFEMDQDIMESFFVSLGGNSWLNTCSEISNMFDFYIWDIYEYIHPNVCRQSDILRILFIWIFIASIFISNMLVILLIEHPIIASKKNIEHIGTLNIFTKSLWQKTQQCKHWRYISLIWKDR